MVENSVLIDGNQVLSGFLSLTKEFDQSHFFAERNFLSVMLFSSLKTLFCLVVVDHSSGFGKVACVFSAETGAKALEDCGVKQGLITVKDFILSIR